MTTNNRKPRSDSITAQVQAFSNAQKTIPTPPLPREAKKFFDALILSKSHDEWTPAQVSIAAEVATDQALMGRMRQQIATAGDVVADARGNLALHPAHKIMDMAAKRISSGMRMLQLGAIKDSRDLIQGRRLEEDARRLIESSGEDSLLA